MKALVVLQPAFYSRGLMRRIIITNNVNVLILWRRLVNLAQEGQPFLMTIPLSERARDFSCQRVQRREQGRYAIALVFMVAALPFFIGRPGWVLSSAWI